MTTATDDARTIPVARAGWMPPRFFLLFGATGLALHFALGGPTWLRLPGLGAALVAASVTLVLWGARTFASVGTTIKPYERTRQLVETGPFRLTRNPMYLGGVGILAGAALLTGTPAPWLATLALALTLHLRFIRNEERALTASLGTPYESYCRRVRRWI
ncbi:MAG TPA: isoprenylcysteine carboxylmethyltransferase family protein [Myxococcota bacterium]|nr:isoprenylcysteine carboxylmethyltransferase family protein [Myxococcota bacterium]